MEYDLHLCYRPWKLLDLADLMSRGRAEEEPETRKKMVHELIEWRARQELKILQAQEERAAISKKLKADDTVGETPLVEEAPPHLQSPAQRALSGLYSENPEEVFSEEKLQKHMNLLVRGATVDMEDMGCCESVVKKVEQITKAMAQDTYHSDSPYNSDDEEEEDPLIIEMYDMACSAVGWSTPPTYKLPSAAEMQYEQKQDKYTSHIKQALRQYQNGETQTQSDEPWARDNEAN